MSGSPVWIVRGRRAVGVEQLDLLDLALARAPARAVLAVGDAVDVHVGEVLVDRPRPRARRRRSLPCSSSATSSQRLRTEPSACETITIVLPLCLSSANFSEHRRWNSSSPTASTSSTSRMSGSTLIATEKPSRTYMPDE